MVGEATANLYKSTERTNGLVAARDWFAGGERIGYDPKTGTIGATNAPLKVFLRREGDVTNTATFLPGYPDGSFGWAKVLPHLPHAADMPKLFIEYVGMGDSDKPKDYVYSTAERADMVEAIWRHYTIQSTVLVAFDFSSLVVLEHLQRRLERASQSGTAAGPAIRGVYIFNGGLFTDGHSHPWFTTPILRSMPDMGMAFMGRFFPIFKALASVMWSQGYRVSDAEVKELYEAMSRHDGLFYLSRAAGFVADHKVQGTRLDFGRLFAAYHNQFPFFVGGSQEDPFEHRQVDLSEERLKHHSQYAIQIERLPGGHLTTNEQPTALAASITKFVQGCAK